MEWAQFKWLFWNTNDWIVKSIFSITSGFSLCYRPRFATKICQIMTSTTSADNFTTIWREVTNLSSNFNQLPDDVLYITDSSH